MRKEESYIYCDVCGKEMEDGVPNGVIIEKGSAIHGAGNSVFYGDFCSKACFLKKFNKEADRLGLK